MLNDLKHGSNLVEFFLGKNDRLHFYDRIINRLNSIAYS
jgi:hypothetical protein